MVYIISNRPNGTRYFGVTADVARRVWEHRECTGSEFVRKYRLTWLVYAEHHEEITGAIQREKNVKDWKRAWKVPLIYRMNLEWLDLYDGLHL